MRARLVASALIAILPSRCKPVCYRLVLGYRIGRRVKIGRSVIDVAECVIADDVEVGHGNVFTGVARLVLDDHVRVGHLNLIRGGKEVVLGRYAEVLRLNQLNATRHPVVVNPTDPRLSVGAGSVITSGHKIDFTDRVTLGRRVILGGRNSTIWTHNRQRTAPVSVGDMTYLGSEIRMAPGAAVPARCIVGIGAVIVNVLDQPDHLIVGVPGRSLRPLTEDQKFLVTRKTRDDLPDDV